MAAALFLLHLIFISKISLNWILPIPYSWGGIIFQHGLHPYVNFALNFLLGIFVVKKFLTKNTTDQQGEGYRFLIALIIATLLGTTFAQIIFLDNTDSIWLQLGALIFTLLLIFVYGRALPSLISPEKFVQVLGTSALVYSLISLVLFLVMKDVAFKGGRFVGVFKHIPHMVTTATLAFVFYIPKVLNHDTQVSMGRLLARVFILSCLFGAVILTGTRSSVAAALLGLVLGFYLFPRKSFGFQFFKVAASVIFVLILAFFGGDIFNHTRDIAVGEKGLGQREAQDGVASRTEEIYRGIELFQQNPYSGHGLLFKFQSSEGEASVAGYNSFKDPHNFFVSAGVVGGWPLLIVAGIAFIAIIYGSWRGLRSQSVAIKTIALFIAVHIPIMFIYHLHFSVGGIADRIYWLCFGYLALRVSQKPEIRENLTGSA